MEFSTHSPPPLCPFPPLIVKAVRVVVPPLFEMNTTRFSLAPCQTHAPLSTLQAMDAYLNCNVNWLLELIPSVELNVPADKLQRVPVTRIRKTSRNPRRGAARRQLPPKLPPGNNLAAEHARDPQNRPQQHHGLKQNKKSFLFERCLRGVLATEVVGRLLLVA